MSEDSEAIAISKEKTPSDVAPVFVSALSRLPYKLLGFLFIIYIFLSSDVFINRILPQMDGCVGYGNTATTKGTILTGLLLVLFVAIIDELIRRDIL